MRRNTRKVLLLDRIHKNVNLLDSMKKERELINKIEFFFFQN